MWTVASLIIFKSIQFSRRACSSRYQEAFLAKQKSWAERLCLVYQEAFLSKQHLWSHWQRGCSAPTRVLIKTSWQTDRMLRKSKFPEPYALLGSVRWSTTASNTPGVKRPLCGYFFSWKMCFHYSSSRRNWVSGSFCESNQRKPDLKLFNFLPLY